MAVTKKLGIVYDSNKCVGCQACALACKAQNNVPDGVSRLQVHVEIKGKFPKPRMDFHRQSCVMCEDAPCVSVCPTKASYTNEQGVNLINQNKCIGCKYCIVACPYQARFANPVTGAADKCTFCWETLTSKGQKPACVTSCPTGALSFGDVNDPNSEFSAVVAKTHVIKPKAHLRTHQKVVTIPNWRGGME